MNLKGESEGRVENLKAIRTLNVEQRLLSTQSKGRGRLEEKLSVNRTFSSSLDKS